ncbi:MAG: helix-turn-helix domain-containing protein, partial [Gordonia sp. (in: high G+C Gram-positive bacteria)]
MGRNPGYDATELIRGARDLFWRKGFDAVSVSEIEAATGVGRSSIYHAFGNMRGLFDAAVDDYLTTVVRPRLEPLITEPVAPEAIGDYLRAVRETITGLARRDTPTGCLLLVSASAPIGTDTAVHAVIAAYRDELSAAVASGVAARLATADTTVIERHTRL